MAFLTRIFLMGLGGVILFSSMTHAYTYKIIEKKASSVIQFLENEITTEATHVKPLNPISPRVIVAKANNKIIGGIVGYFYYGSLFIDVLWVNKDHRKQGIGSTLIHKLEKLAKQENISFSVVHTMDFWNAGPFYEKHGYSIEFKRSGYQNESSLVSLIKHFNKEAAL